MLSTLKCHKGSIPRGGKELSTVPRTWQTLYRTHLFCIPSCRRSQRERPGSREKDCQLSLPKPCCFFQHSSLTFNIKSVTNLKSNDNKCQSLGTLWKLYLQWQILKIYCIPIPTGLSFARGSCPCSADGTQQTAQGIRPGLHWILQKEVSWPVLSSK